MLRGVRPGTPTSAGTPADVVSVPESAVLNAFQRLSTEIQEARGRAAAARIADDSEDASGRRTTPRGHRLSQSMRSTPGTRGSRSEREAASELAALRRRLDEAHDKLNAQVTKRKALERELKQKDSAAGKAKKAAEQSTARACARVRTIQQQMQAAKEESQRMVDRAVRQAKEANSKATNAAASAAQESDRADRAEAALASLRQSARRSGAAGAVSAGSDADGHRSEAAGEGGSTAGPSTPTRAGGPSSGPPGMSGSPSSRTPPGHSPLRPTGPSAGGVAPAQQHGELIAAERRLRETMDLLKDAERRAATAEGELKEMRTGMEDLRKQHRNEARELQRQLQQSKEKKEVARLRGLLAAAEKGEEEAKQRLAREQNTAREDAADLREQLSAAMKQLRELREKAAARDGGATGAGSSSLGKGAGEEPLQAPIAQQDGAMLSPADAQVLRRRAEDAEGRALAAQRDRDDLREQALKDAEALRQRIQDLERAGRLLHKEQDTSHARERRLRELTAELVQAKSQANETEHRMQLQVEDLKRRLREAQAEGARQGPRSAASAEYVAELRLQAKDADRRAGHEARRAEAAASELREAKEKARTEVVELQERLRSAQRKARQMQQQAEGASKKLEQEVQRQVRQKEREVRVFREVSGRALHATRPQDQELLAVVRVLEGRASGLEREVKGLREQRDVLAKALSKACAGLRGAGQDALAVEVQVAVRQAQFAAAGGSHHSSGDAGKGDASGGSAAGGWDVQDVRIDAVRERLAAEQEGMRDREEAHEAAREHATELAASLAEEVKRLEIELAEVKGERDALRVDLGARPSVRQWRDSRRQVEELERRVEAAMDLGVTVEQLDVRSRDLAEEEKARRRQTPTAVLARSDRLAHRLGLQVIDALPRDVCTGILREICVALELSDPYAAAAGVRTLVRVVHGLPPVEAFLSDAIETICEATDGLPQFDGDRARGAEAGAQGSSGRSVPPMLRGEALAAVLRRLRYMCDECNRCGELLQLRRQVERELGARDSGAVERLRDMDRARDGGVTSDGVTSAEGYTDAGIVKAVRGLVRLESAASQHGAVYEAAEAAQRGDRSVLSSIVRHYQDLFEVPNLQGTFASMSQLRFAASEHTALMASLRVELGLRAGTGVGPGSVVAAVRQLKKEVARSSAADAGAAAGALYALAGSKRARGASGAASVLQG